MNDITPSEAILLSNGLAGSIFKQEVCAEKRLKKAVSPGIL